MIAWFGGFGQLGWNNAGRITKLSKMHMPSYAFMEMIRQRHAFSIHDFANGDYSCVQSLLELVWEANRRI